MRCIIFFKKQWIFIFILSIAVYSSGFCIYPNMSDQLAKAKKETILYIDMGPHEESPKNGPYNKNIPSVYLYRIGNIDSLRNYLSEKNSLLSEEPYFSEIIKQAKAYNLNPSLLFAITGGEQSFVPKTNKFAEKIANNPFNVFGSWQEYNTNISDCAQIACRTIIHLSESRPPDAEFIEWINTCGGKGGYAENENWYKDVRAFFDYINTNVY